MKPAVKVNLILASMFLIGAFVMMQMGWYVVHQITGVSLQWNLFSYCLTALQKLSFGYDILKFLFNFVIAYTVLRMFIRIVRQLYLSIKWTRVFRQCTDQQQSRALNDTYRDWDIEIIVVKDDAFIALSMGLFHPRIIVSTGLLNMFSAEETRAILLHEWYHCKTRDPLLMFLVVLMTDSMGYIPLIKKLSHQFMIQKELLADRFALKHMNTAYYLGSVLLKLTSIVHIRHVSGTVSFANTGINYRILQVLKPNETLKVPFSFGKSLLGSMMILFLIIAIIWGSC